MEPSQSNHHEQLEPTGQSSPEEAAREKEAKHVAAFKSRLLKNLTQLRERAGAAFVAFGRRLEPVLAPLREKVGDRAAVYGLAGLAMLLIAAVLFVPPLSLVQRIGKTGYQRLSVEAPTISHQDGLTVHFAGEALEDGLHARLGSIPRLDLLGPVTDARRKATDAHRRAVDALPEHVQIKSPLYLIEIKGRTHPTATIDVAVPNDAQPWERLDLYGWSGEAWAWIGGELHAEAAGQEFLRARVSDIPQRVVVVQADAQPQTVSTSLGPEDDLATLPTAVDELNPIGLMLGPGGSIDGRLDQQPDTDAYVVRPTLRNWTPGPSGIIDRHTLVEILAPDGEAREAHIVNLAALCTENGFAGVEIDYRGVAPDERELYSTFITALAKALHAQDLTLSVVLTAPASTEDTGQMGGYDWRAIGRAAEAVKVPFPDDPSAYVEGGRAQRLLDWATARVSRYKLHMQVSSLSVERGPDESRHIPLNSALALFGEVTLLNDRDDIEPGQEVALNLSGGEDVTTQVTQGSYTIQYRDRDDAAYTIWPGTAANLSAKMQWARRYHLGGVSIRDMLHPGNAPGVIEAVAAYRDGATPDADQPIEVVWTVANADLLLHQQNIPLTAPSLGYTWLVADEADTYTITAQIAGHERGSVAVVVAEPTPAPERLETSVIETDCLAASFITETVPDGTRFEAGEPFTKTWTLKNSGTCAWPEGTELSRVDSETGGPESVSVGQVAVGESAVITVEMAAPEEDGRYDSEWTLQVGDAAFAKVWAVIQVGEVGGYYTGLFELGGQTHTLEHPDEMHYAGMTWVKFQHKWGPGDDPNAVKDRITTAHANGFKILLSIPGSTEYPSSIDFGSYVEFLRGVAALGPDAIEIWNEQNIDFEWPKGEISPSAYVQHMLAPAYTAIKLSNPNVMVISGAPAPTGYFGGCSPQGCDDAPYIAGMLAAGAANYADCVGVHYNEGILPPTQTSGDPRGSSGHYTRYFWGMANTYYSAFGGQRPLCFTELGYLSPEGYGALPAKYAWAADTSVEEHATWLAQAASQSASSGKIRLMIIFNVDIFHWGADPQAGYAIIRPGGSCPACEKLHAVFGSR